MASQAEKVGVRELRQNLSKYLTRVKAGESLVVTERGREVAKLVPNGNVAAPYADLVERFGATPPARDMRDVLAELDTDRRAPDGTTDAFLAESRRERV